MRHDALWPVYRNVEGFADDQEIASQHVFLRLACLGRLPERRRRRRDARSSGGSVYVSPDAAPLANAVVVASAGVISAVGAAGEIDIPDDARIIDCIGKTIVAGFWNSYVHFTERVWVDAGTAPAGPLAQHMQEMLTRWGFTAVWDLGSDPRVSL